METMFELLDDCEKEEDLYQFDHFTRADALALGLRIHENAQDYLDPVAMEITLNGLSVFRYFPEGTTPDNEKWLARKRNSVELMQKSSLHFFAWLQTHDESLADRKLSMNDYAAAGGGFPIRLRGSGVIGSVCVSGLPEHRDDHRLLVDSLADFLTGK